MATAAARPHSAAYSDVRRSASVEFHSNADQSSVKRTASVMTPRKSRNKSPELIGDYLLYSTLGQGSMGKVKLARNRRTGQLAAVKILPIQSLNDPTHKSKDPKDTPEHRLRRTQREIAIMLLLNHSNICKLLHWEIHDNNYYIFLEYVDGGQLLDYIIGHGKLKERQARKFARQILSAIDYCHRNSIVHRDLKIENILLTRDENIKIIDFGLSNIYSPKSTLSTFCGSLYFAAPELLQAKKYTGPEVDIWSFGVVLFVLVAGRVPFDDTNMPALHSKIKAGVVNYPDHLSRDCVDLLKSILVVDSAKRATVAQVAAHPWMNKRYETAIENELPKRKPLQLPIDGRIVEGMHGFGLGSVEEIQKKLENVIESSEYQDAAQVIQNTPQTYQIKYVPQQQNKWRLKEQAPKRVIVPSNDDPQSQPAMYDPLISIYYLVKERQLVYREDLIHAHETLVPDLGVSEKPTPIITNTETSESEKKTLKKEADGDDAANNHIKFTKSTKVDDGVPPNAQTTSDTKNERRTSKRLSSLFQGKRASWDSKKHPTDVSPRQSASRVAKSGSQDDEQKEKVPDRPQPMPPTPTASQSTPVKRTLQQNVSNIGRRLTFKSKSRTKLTETPAKESKLSNDVTTANGQAAKSAAKPSTTRPPKRASSPVSLKKEGGLAGFFRLNSPKSHLKEMIKPRQEALQGIKGFAKHQLFHGPPEQLLQHLLQALEQLKIEIASKSEFEVQCRWTGWKGHLEDKSSTFVNGNSDSSRSSDTLNSIDQNTQSLHREVDGNLSPAVTARRHNSVRRSSQGSSESLQQLDFSVIIFSVTWAKRFGIRVQACAEQDKDKYSPLFKKAEQLILDAVEIRCKQQPLITI
ncbi:Serine/threonine-protein kinase [Umbelopsis sp. WA50703]